jgi:hypothetical protein
MGANGVDIMFSPAARRVFGPLAIECKNVEALNVVSTFLAHAEKYPQDIPYLVHKRNRTVPLCTLRFTDLLRLLERSLQSAN